MLKRIAVLSSGSDNSGVNGAIRAVVRTAAGKGIRCFGVKWGYRGLFEDQVVPLTSRDVSGKIGKAGCFLGTSPTTDPLTQQSQMVQCLNNLNKRSIEGMIVIGGAGSLAASKLLIDRGIPVIGIPSTIQDNIPGTDTSLGVDSAINNIMKSIDHIRSCDSSRNRSFLVQVEGRDSGMLAYRAAVVSGAEVCLIPEFPGELEAVAKTMADANMRGKTQCIAVISTGWQPGIDALSSYLEKHENETDLSVRKTVLGYVQRGGAPTGFDRLLGTRLGAAAVEALINGQSAQMTGFCSNKVKLVPYSEIIGKIKTVQAEDLYLFRNNTA